MAFCHISADNTAFVTATYLVALLPWSVLSFWDPINRNWTPYWKVFWKSCIYLILSILPYFILIPYAILQGCSEDSDTKELLTAIVTMFASLWNLRRAVRGLFALHEIRRIWEQVHIREIAVAFDDWLPERSDSPWSEGKLEKLDVADILISHNLIDNDWPGEAPQTAYIRNRSSPKPRPWHDIYFPSVQAVDSDIIEKRCILTLWSFWMVHASDLLRIHNLMKRPRYPCFRNCVQWLLGSKEQSDESSNFSSEHSQCSIAPLVNWFRHCFQCQVGKERTQDALPATLSELGPEHSQRDLPLIVQNSNQQETLPANSSEVSLDSEWVCPACDNKYLFSRGSPPCTWCALRPLVTRALDVYKGFDEYSTTILEFALLNQLSNLPSHVQGRLKLSDGARILRLYSSHYSLDRSVRKMLEGESVQDNLDPRCPVLRMGLVLGLSSLYRDVLDRWLRSSVESDDCSLSDRLEISPGEMNRKFLSFAVLLAAQDGTIYPNHIDLSLTANLRRMGHIVRTIRVLVYSSPHMEPLDVFQKHNQAGWNALLSSVFGESWGESSSRSKSNTAVRKELLLLRDALEGNAIPSDELKYLSSCVAYTFKDIKTDPVSFYSNNEHRVVPAKDTILTNEDCWTTRDDNRKVVWRGVWRRHNLSTPFISAEARFPVQNAGQHLKAGLAFRFPSWKNKSWPTMFNYGTVDFVISVRDEQTESLVFQSEPLSVFHFAHFTDARPWTKYPQHPFPLETLHMLFGHAQLDLRWEAPGQTDDHSYWRLLECGGIQISSSGTSIITLSLMSTDSLDDGFLELDSFWIAEQTEVSEIEQSSLNTLSAMRKIVN